MSEIKLHIHWFISLLLARHFVSEIIRQTHTEVCTRKLSATCFITLVFKTLGAKSHTNIVWFFGASSGDNSSEEEWGIGWKKKGALYLISDSTRASKQLQLVLRLCASFNLKVVYLKCLLKLLLVLEVWGEKTKRPSKSV